MISSPLLRARQTAEAFGMPYEVDDRWVELDYGSLDGVPIADVGDEVWAQMARRLDLPRRWRREHATTMRDRVIAAAEEVLAEAESPDCRRHLARLADQGRGHVGARCRRDRRVAMPSRSGVGLSDPCRPAGPLLLGFNETRRSDSSWRQ